MNKSKRFPLSYHSQQNTKLFNRGSFTANPFPTPSLQSIHLLLLTGGTRIIMETYKRKNQQELDKAYQIFAMQTVGVWCASDPSGLRSLAIIY